VGFDQTDSYIKAGSRERTSVDPDRTQGVEPLVFVATRSSRESAGEKEYSLVYCEPDIQGDSHEMTTLYPVFSKKDIVFGTRTIHGVATSPERHDRRYLCFLLGDDENGTDVVVQEFNGSEPGASRTIGRTTGGASQPAWHPSQERVYVCAVEGTGITFGAYICYFETHGDENQEPVTLLGRPDRMLFFPDVSLDGSRICFTFDPRESWVYKREIWTASLDGKGTSAWGCRHLTRDDVADYSCRFSTADESILCLSYEEEGSYWLSALRGDFDCPRPEAISKERLRQFELPQNLCATSFSISASGRIAVACTTPPPEDKQIILILDSTGAELGRISSDEWRVSSPCF